MQYCIYYQIKILILMKSVVSKYRIPAGYIYLVHNVNYGNSLPKIPTYTKTFHKEISFGVWCNWKKYTVKAYIFWVKYRLHRCPICTYLIWLKLELGYLSLQNERIYVSMMGWLAVGHFMGSYLCLLNCLYKNHIFKVIG